MAKGMDCVLQDDKVVINDDLQIAFKRTIRVPDNDQVSFLPPNLGRFPLNPVSEYGDKLKPEMAAKGGIFFPMFQSEAMWIDFHSRRGRDYMIKIYVGGVNAISGEPAVEDAATKLRRQARIAANRGRNTASAVSPLQDYVVVPPQPWLDGIADTNGTVRQFVAMPFGSGYSVEHQVTGKDSTGGIQFEITPYKRIAHDHYTKPSPVPAVKGNYKVFIKTLIGKQIEIHANETDTVYNLKSRVQGKEGIPPDQQRLIWKGSSLEDHRTLANYHIPSRATVHIVLRLRGGGDGKPPRQEEMSVAAGGKIKQVIKPDTHGSDWLEDKTTVFNVQIVNSAVYRRVIGDDPPSKPIDAKTYQTYGLPFFKLYEEPSGISGEFSIVKSVGQIDNNIDKHVNPLVFSISNAAGGYSTPGPADLINPNGTLRPFRTVKDLEKEFSGYHVANF